MTAPIILFMTFYGSWGGSAADFAYDLTCTPDGYLLAGRTDSYAQGGSDAWLLAVGPDGDSLWSASYGGQGPDWAYTVIPVSAGGYLVTGRLTAESGDLDGWLLRLDDSGGEIWSRSFGGTGTQTFFASIEAPGGGFVSTGFRTGTGFDLWVVGTDPDGNQAWETVLGGSADDCGYSLAPSADGFVVAGQTLSWGAGGGDLWVVRFDWEGDSLSSDLYGGTEFDYPWSICALPSGGHAVSCTSRSFGAGSYDFWVLMLDAAGQLQWAEAYGYADDDWCYHARPAGDGVVVTGNRNLGGYDAWVLRLDAQGDTLWTSSFGSGGADRGSCTVQTPEGGYAMCGGLLEGSAQDFWLVVMDEDGQCPQAGIGGAAGAGPEAAAFLYPNPAAGAFRISLPGHDGTPLPWQVFDLQGRLVDSGVAAAGAGGSTGEIAPDLPADGVFLVRVPGHVLRLVRCRGAV